jgi:uncharacterized protein (TIGR00645 family)
MKKAEASFEKLIFFSRWFQAPMYVGLIIGSVLYSGVFLYKLWGIFEEAIRGLGGHGGHEHGRELSEVVLLGVLGLVDMLMVANLVVMVIIGGYSTFVSRLEIEHHADRPDWLQKVNAGTLKVKLAASLATVSGIHLLQSFVQIHHEGLRVDLSGQVLPVSQQPVVWQIVIHVVFLLSTMMLARADKVLHSSEKHGHDQQS